ncbi:MAG: hypothetical protein FJ279_35445 [Planctomycetes bacterium]|nr:hypothetical protein [Planctomycetota bacterium]MBM4084371.1 hypothetical protein [Planctomycetota bacterium]
MPHDPSLHLFVDEHEVQERVGFTRVVERPRRLSLEPVLRPDQAWEGRAVIGWGSVVRAPETGKLRMYYKCREKEGRVPADMSIIGLAESADGMCWEKPDLGLVAFGGSKRNNIVYRPDDFGDDWFTDGAGVCVEPNPGPERYKMATFLTGGARQEFGIYGMASEDGVHWTRPPKPLLPWQGDRFNFGYDDRAKRYVVTTRRQDNWRDSKLGRQATRRVIAWAESEDFHAFTPLTTVLKPDDLDPFDTQFYGMVPFAWGNCYLGFLEIYDRQAERLHVQLASSRDGRHWERVGQREPFLETGGEGSWDSNWVAFTGNPPFLFGDEMRMWYTGRWTGHGVPQVGAIGALAMRRDRFVGLAARREGGMLITEPVELTGQHLLINVNPRGGMLQVELLGDSALPLPGFTRDECAPLKDDRVAAEVVWKDTSLATLRGRTVRLRITGHNATVYAFRLTDAVSE